MKKRMELKSKAMKSNLNNKKKMFSN